MKTFAANNILQLKKGLCLIALLMISLLGSSQLQNKADLSITSMTIVDDVPVRGGNLNVKTSFANLKCSITLHNETGNLVNQVMLAVVLPPDITIVSNPNTATAYYSGNGNRGGWLGSLVFDLHMMSPGQDMIVEFTFTRSSSYANTIGAYVFGGCPDTNPANNYKYAAY